MPKVKLTIAESKCRCGYFKKGQEFIVEDLCPPLCHELWNRIYPFVYALQNGASLDYGDCRAKMFDAACPDKGRLQINSYHMAPYRETIYKVVDRLLESRDCRDAWRSYKAALERYDDVVNYKNHYSSSDRSMTEIRKTKQQIANLILQGKKDFIRDNSYDRLLSNDNYRSDDGDKGKIYKNPSIVRDRLASRNPDKAITKGIGSLLSKRQREIEKEISEYLDSHKSYDKGYEMSM
nr:TIGR04076 family protein [Clostridia bacterium]